MKLSEFIRAAQSLAGDFDPEVVLYNRELDIELRNDPDNNIWQYELMRGDDELVIEFD